MLAGDLLSNIWLVSLPLAPIAQVKEDCCNHPEHQSGYACVQESHLPKTRSDFQQQQKCDSDECRESNFGPVRVRRKQTLAGWAHGNCLIGKYSALSSECLGCDKPPRELRPTVRAVVFHRALRDVDRKTLRGNSEEFHMKVVASPRKIYIVCSHKIAKIPSSINLVADS
jgi:hypothetical protein